MPTGEEGRNILHLLRRLGRARKIITELILEFLLVLWLLENVPAIIKDLAITIEQDSVDLALPGIKSLHGGYPVIGGPVRIFWILQELFHADYVRFLRHKKIAIEPSAGHVSVVFVGGLQVGKDLLVKGVDRNLSHIHLAASFLFPFRHPIFESVAH